MDAPVECHSGFAYAEYPTAIHWEGERLPIVEILNRWRAPRGKGFQVRAANDLVFELFYDESDGQWALRRL